MQTQARIKYRPDLSGNLHPYELTVFSRPVGGRKSSGRVSIEDQICEARDYQSEARRRAVSRCRDLGACAPDLGLFVTLTLDASRINRYDYTEIVRSASTWLDNRVRRDGLKYLLVPELHKDGAIHFHGMINDVLARTNSGIRHAGKVVYNLPAWSYGFTTAQRITGQDGAWKVAQYCLKYMTKSTEKIGGRYYLHGGAFAEPFVAWTSIPWEAVPCTAFQVAKDLEVRVCRNELTISELLRSYAGGALGI
jgi:hypothetical protein